MPFDHHSPTSLCLYTVVLFSNFRVFSLIIILSKTNTKLVSFLLNFFFLNISHFIIFENKLPAPKAFLKFQFWLFFTKKTIAHQLNKMSDQQIFLKHTVLSILIDLKSEELYRNCRDLQSTIVFWNYLRIDYDNHSSFLFLILRMDWAQLLSTFQQGDVSELLK